nr:hypothetical protein Hi04_10k_c2441A_00022 [uncultured bacterium]UXE44485.1 hypothetical protein Hi04_10k_c2441B_00033 [uncultured bacterium]
MLGYGALTRAKPCSISCTVTSFVLSNRPPRPAVRRALWKRPWVVASAVLLLGVAVVVRHEKRSVEADVHPVRIQMSAATRASILAALPGVRDATLHTKDGLALSGWFAPGTNGAAVVLTPGAWSNRSQLAPEAERLHRAGYGVLIYDLRASGESEGDLCTWGDRERNDVEAGVDFVASQPGVEHVGAIGFSIGAYALSSAAADDRRIEAFVLEGATPSVREGEQWEDRAYHGLMAPTLQIYRLYGVDIDAIDVVAALRRMAPRPTLVVIGSDDPFIPRWMTDEIVAAAPEPKAEYTVVGAKHGGYAEAGGAAYLDRVAQFFDRYLVGAGARTP